VWNNGQVFMDELFGNGERNGFKNTIERDMRSALSSDFTIFKRYNRQWYWPETWEQVVIGPMRVKQAPGDLTPQIRKLDAGEPLVASAQAVVTEVVKVARDVALELRLRSPVGSRSKYRYSKGRGPGGYKANHEVWLNGRPVRGNPKTGEEDVAQVFNRTDYAAVIEAPGNYRVYQDVMKWAQKKYFADYDFRIEWARASTLGGSFVPAAGGKGMLPYRRGVSNFPVITIAAKGTIKRGAWETLARTSIRRRGRKQRVRRFT
jgi:hypothetical protein